MSEQWAPLPLSQPLFANLDPDAVVGYQTAIENGFGNELGGYTRFPGLRQVADLDPNAKRVYLSDFNDDLVAATDKGQVYRLDRDYTVENVTGAPVSGGNRVIFAKTDRDLLMAACGPIIRLRDRKTELLSRDAPRASHVCWLDDFTIAIEVNSGRFSHSRAGQPDVWDALDTFSADGDPDNINSAVVTPFRELLLGGPHSIEQFERTATGEVPFYRRWAVGTGTKLPYALTFAESGTWTINHLTEWVKFSGQSYEPVSDAIGRVLQSVDDWTETWMGPPLHILGQKFIILQMPRATNSYGTKGITFALDYRARKFFELYGWDRSNGVPARWPGWSYTTIWNRTFVGGEGKIYELTADTYRHGDGIQRMLVRTSHLAQGAGAIVKALRLRIKRGIGTSTTAPTIRVRCSRDARPFGAWITRSLGKSGQRQQFLEFGSFGSASSFQFEISSADDAAIDLMGADVKVDPLGH